MHLIFSRWNSWFRFRLDSCPVHLYQAKILATPTIVDVVRVGPTYNAVSSVREYLIVTSLNIRVTALSSAECKMVIISKCGYRTWLRNVVDVVMSEHCFTMKLMMLCSAADRPSTFSFRTWPARLGLWWCDCDFMRFSQCGWLHEGRWSGDEDADDISPAGIEWHRRQRGGQHDDR